MSILKIKKLKLSKPISFIKLIPNCLTLIGLVIGITSIRFAIESRWEMAVYCVFIAAIIDGLDGRIARLLNAATPLGAQLDSLCDFANFGVAPAFLIYLWTLPGNLLSWSNILLFVICMAIRLARFNVSIGHTHNMPSARYFAVGVPAPAGALLSLMPLILTFALPSDLSYYIRGHVICINIYLTAISFFVASRLPTFLLKNIKIKPEYLSLSMMLLGLMIILLIVHPWYMLPILGAIYIFSMPFCYMIAQKLNKESNKKKTNIEK